MSSSSSSSRSSSPEPLSKAESKRKGKKRTPTNADGPRNEGVDQNWAYHPPDGAVLLNNPQDLGQFDWDDVQRDENIDIWLIRVPDSIKPKHLENITIQLPTDPSTSKIGHITKKNAEFDLYLLGEDADIGAEEVSRLSCVLPRKSTKGEMYLAPRSVSRRLVVTASQPSSSNTAQLSQNPKRPKYPAEALKHTFKPYGAGFGVEQQADLDVDAPMEVEEVKDAEAERPHKVETPKTASKTHVKKGKKRKEDGTGEVPSPKKKKSKH